LAKDEAIIRKRADQRFSRDKDYPVLRPRHYNSNSLAIFAAAGDTFTGARYPLTDRF
jgi:hypothetical protein